MLLGSILALLVASASAHEFDTPDVSVYLTGLRLMPNDKAVLISFTYEAVNKHSTIRDPKPPKTLASQVGLLDLRSRTFTLFYGSCSETIGSPDAVSDLSKIVFAVGHPTQPVEPLPGTAASSSRGSRPRSAIYVYSPGSKRIYALPDNGAFRKASPKFLDSNIVYYVSQYFGYTVINNNIRSEIADKATIEVFNIANQTSYTIDPHLRWAWDFHHSGPETAMFLGGGPSDAAAISQLVGKKRITAEQLRRMPFVYEVNFGSNTTRLHPINSLIDYPEPPSANTLVSILPDGPDQMFFIFPRDEAIRHGGSGGAKFFGSIKASTFVFDVSKDQTTYIFGFHDYNRFGTHSADYIGIQTVSDKQPTMLNLMDLVFANYALKNCPAP